MVILAKAVKGKEYLYNPKSAHMVSKASADYILSVVNSYKYRLKDGETWHKYEIDEYDTAYYYAVEQHFSVRKGVVSAYTYSI